MNHWRFFLYVLRHKWFVLWECIRLDVPIWRALLHDVDKFLPDVWFSYVNAFGKGTGRRRFADTPEIALATQRHYRFTLHHWQSWILVWDQGDSICIPMPDTHRREMLADWTGAGKANGFPNIGEWYYTNADKIRVHGETREWLEGMLNDEYYWNGDFSHYRQNAKPRSANSG